MLLSGSGRLVATDRGVRLDEAARMAIRAVIQAQFDAFHADDAARAFALMSDEIQHRSGSPAAFMAMVRSDLAPLLHPRAVFFQDVSVLDGTPTQRVLVMDASGTAVLAVYPMQRRGDGEWRIAGCRIYRGAAGLM